MKKQKTLFTQAAPEPPQDGDIEYIGQKLPGDFADYILLEPGDEPADLATVEVRVVQAKPEAKT
jgi:hypothetical protein